MLIVVQIPFADVRSFLPTDSGKLAKPPFPLAAAGKDFVRGTGQVRDRRRGGLPAWSGEELFCDATSGVRFAADSAAEATMVTYPWRCAFRRYFAVGTAASRLEVGFSSPDGRRPESEPDGREILRRLTATRVRMPDQPGQSAGHSLPDAGNAASRWFLNATTRNGYDLDRQSWWLTAGTPLVIARLPPNVNATVSPVEVIEPSPVAGASLSYSSWELNGRLVPVWWIAVSKHVDPGRVRELRLHLQRMHMEHNALAGVLRQLGMGNVPVEPGSDASNRLQDYLNDDIRRLEQPIRGGFAQGPLLDAIQRTIAQVSGAERATLFAELEKARRQVARKAITFAERSASQWGSVGGKQPIIITERTTVGGEHYNTNVGGDMVGSNIGHDNVIADSFARIEKSTAPEEVKRTLIELQHEVASLLKQVDSEQADANVESLQEDYADLRDEALRDEPQPNRLQRFAEVVMSTGNAIGDIGVPLVTLVRKLMALL